jgi:serine/threonine protein kinase
MLRLPTLDCVKRTFLTAPQLLLFAERQVCNFRLNRLKNSRFLEYLAPEVLEENDYGRAVDWWGLGVVM